MNSARKEKTFHVNGIDHLSNLPLVWEGGLELRIKTVLKKCALNSVVGH